jgi:hypothetical protein
MAPSPIYRVYISLHRRWVFSVCCPFTRPLVPSSNGGRSPSWVPELYPCHSHSNSWLTVYSLELFWNCFLLSLVMSSNNISSACYLPCLVITVLELCPTTSVVLSCPRRRRRSRYYDRRSVSLGVVPSFGANDQIFYFHFLVWQLLDYWSGTSSLTRGQVSSLLYRHSLVRAAQVP